MSDLALRALERTEPLSPRHRMALVRAGRAQDASVLPGDLVEVECCSERFLGIVGPSGLYVQKLNDKVIACYRAAHDKDDPPTWTLVMPREGIYYETNAIANSPPIGEKVNSAKSNCVRNESPNPLFAAVSSSGPRGIGCQSA